jgi:hypothetical protein
MSRELDREELHSKMQEQELIEVLDTVRGHTESEILNGIGTLGKRVEKAANGELLTELKEPLDSGNQLVGFLSLLYEAENETRVEQELSQLFREESRETTE